MMMMLFLVVQEAGCRCSYCCRRRHAMVSLSSLVIVHATFLCAAAFLRSARGRRKDGLQPSQWWNSTKRQEFLAFKFEFEKLQRLLNEGTCSYTIQTRKSPYPILEISRHFPREACKLHVSTWTFGCLCLSVDLSLSFVRSSPSARRHHKSNEP